MKHLGQVSAMRDARTMSSAWNGGSRPDFATSAKTDFMNAVWKAFADFVVQKKNEVSL